MSSPNPRTYPYTGWVLLPSFRPFELTFTERYGSWSSNDYGDQTETGKTYQTSEIFPTKGDAITEGRRRLAEQEARLAKQSAAIVKKRAALDKAAA